MPKSSTSISKSDSDTQSLIKNGYTGKTYASVNSITSDSVVQIKDHNVMRPGSEISQESSNHEKSSLTLK